MHRVVFINKAIIVLFINIIDRRMDCRDLFRIYDETRYTNIHTQIFHKIYRQVGKSLKSSTTYNEMSTINLDWKSILTKSRLSPILLFFYCLEIKPSVIFTLNIRVIFTCNESYHNVGKIYFKLGVMVTISTHYVFFF